jgi:hypothetical protein
LPGSEPAISPGLREDFVEALTAAADAMAQSVSDRAQSRGKVSGATRGLRTSLASGRQLVGVIDALLASVLAEDPALLASWTRVKRVRRIASHVRNEPAPAGLQLAARAPAAAVPAPARPVALTSTQALSHVARVGAELACTPGRGPGTAGQAI